VNLVVVVPADALLQRLLVARREAHRLAEEADEDDGLRPAS
jgi:hypothetical protein